MYSENLKKQITTIIKSHVNSTNWADEEASSIINLVHESMEKMENPYHVVPADSPFDQDYKALCFNIFEQARQAILKGWDSQTCIPPTDYLDGQPVKPLSSGSGVFAPIGCQGDPRDGTD